MTCFMCKRAVCVCAENERRMFDNRRLICSVCHSMPCRCHQNWMDDQVKKAGKKFKEELEKDNQELMKKFRDREFQRTHFEDGAGI